MTNILKQLIAVSHPDQNLSFIFEVSSLMFKVKKNSKALWKICDDRESRFATQALVAIWTLETKKDSMFRDRMGPGPCQPELQITSQKFGESFFDDIISSILDQGKIES